MEIYAKKNGVEMFVGNLSFLPTKDNIELMTWGKNEDLLMEKNRIIWSVRYVSETYDKHLEQIITVDEMFDYYETLCVEYKVLVDIDRLLEDGWKIYENK